MGTGPDIEQYVTEMTDKIKELFLKAKETNDKMVRFRVGVGVSVRV